MGVQDQWQTPSSETADFPAAGHLFLNSDLVGEPQILGDCETFKVDGGSCMPDYAECLGQSTAWYEPSLSSTTQLDQFSDMQYESLSYIWHEQPFETALSDWSHLQHPGDCEKEPRPKLSIGSTDTEYSVEDEHPRHICHECNKSFRNLQELDQHSKRSPHRAWKCAEPSCGKMYARRDTFLRHRATHKDKSHQCNACSRLNKQKVFTRKDHLKEHIRNCHSVIKTEDSKLLAMESLVKSLHTVIGNDDKDIEELGQSLTKLSVPEMQTVASSMARAALDKTREQSIGGSKGSCASIRQ